MQIKCPNCNKSFEVGDNLIPTKGRLLQCGICKNKWFFKNKEIETVKLDKPKIQKTENISFKDDTVINKKISPTIKTEHVADKEIIIKDNKNTTNYINLFLVFAITVVSLVIILDTFKSQISNIFPGINFILESLYESLKDISLFFEDLIR